MSVACDLASWSRAIAGVQEIGRPGPAFQLNGGHLPHPSPFELDLSLIGTGRFYFLHDLLSINVRPRYRNLKLVIAA